MNIFKATLDTRHQNGVIGTVTQFDNAVLELQIVTDGQVGVAWDSPQFELLAMKRDANAVREVEQDKFTILSKEDHKVQIELKEQFLTCRGTVKMQLIVKEGNRLSTTLFYLSIGQSLDHDIVDSHRDVAVLDELEAYIKQGFDDLAYQEQRMEAVEQSTNDLNDIMNTNEAKRNKAETIRQEVFDTNEANRTRTFNSQVEEQKTAFSNSQTQRDESFNQSQQNMTQEFEASQRAREDEFDASQKSNQNTFSDNESKRQTTFAQSQRTNQEEFDQMMEDSRQTFDAAELKRKQLFDANEQVRGQNESRRVQNESQRAQAETQRAAAEVTRQQKMTQFEEKATQLSNDLDTQVARVDEFVTSNEGKLLGPNDKKDYMGNSHESVKEAMDANVDWLLGEINTVHYDGQHITAADSIEGHAKSAILKGNTGYRDIDTGEFLETFEEGRNLELVSVKMPVLKTTGKNLFDGELEFGSFYENGINFNSSNCLRSKNLIKVSPNKTYIFSNDKNYTQYIIEFDKNKNPIIAHSSTSFTTSNDTYYIKFRTSEGSMQNDITVKYQLEQGSVATTYEPYKSNILSTSEDVVLRGIGKVRDELNLLTGELTERIVEIVLDGNEGWSYNPNWSNGDYLASYTKFFTSKANGSYNILSNNIQIGRFITNGAPTSEFICGENGSHVVYVCLRKDRLLSSPSDNIDDYRQAFLEYLQKNPIIVQYELATESVKTVDLSDNHVYSYKDVTHYDCSSAEGSLVPTLSIDVPTNLPAVVTRQRVTIQELEKENVALKNEIEETASSSVNGDLELMSSQFELDFRLFEIEMNLDMPMMAMMRGVKSMAMTVYQQAKTLILAGKYEREDMEYKLNRYKAAGRITVEEYEELIALMDARELVD